MEWILLAVAVIALLTAGVAILWCTVDPDWTAMQEIERRLAAIQRPLNPASTADIERRTTHDNQF